MRDEILISNARKRMKKLKERNPYFTKSEALSTRVSVVSFSTRIIMFLSGLLTSSFSIWLLTKELPIWISILLIVVILIGVVLMLISIFGKRIKLEALGDAPANALTFNLIDAIFDGIF